MYLVVLGSTEEPCSTLKAMGSSKSDADVHKDVEAQHRAGLHKMFQPIVGKG